MSEPAPAEPMQVSAAIQMEPLWKHGQAGERAFSGDLGEFTQSMAAYFAENLERFAAPRGADVFVVVTVKRGDEVKSHEYRSGHYVDMKQAKSAPPEDAP